MSNGICKDRQIPGFLREARMARAQKVSPEHFGGRIIRCLAPHPSLLLGAALRAFFAAPRRSYGDPENKCAPLPLETSSLGAPAPSRCGVPLWLGSFQLRLFLLFIYSVFSPFISSVYQRFRFGHLRHRASPAMSFRGILVRRPGHSGVHALARHRRPKDVTSGRLPDSSPERSSPLLHPVARCIACAMADSALIYSFLYMYGLSYSPSVRI